MDRTAHTSRVAGVLCDILYKIERKGCQMANVVVPTCVGRGFRARGNWAGGVLYQDTPESLGPGSGSLAERSVLIDEL